MVEGDSPFPPFETPFEEDTILKVSEEGKILQEVSVPKIMYDNGLEAVLTATGSSFFASMSWDRELVHLNKIGELSTDLEGDFPMFEAGDLVLSIRDLNLVMVVDGAGERVKWWQVGPWIRQHDPEFIPGGRILLFSNNSYSTVFGANPDGQVTPDTTPQVSTVIEVDPVSRETKVVFGGRPGQELLSVVRGKVARTPEGGLLITEEDGGRVLETDSDGRIVWEYINRYSENEVAEVTEARVYRNSYFTVADWTCHYAGE
jgi:hypothetical protein